MNPRVPDSDRADKIFPEMSEGVPKQLATSKVVKQGKGSKNWAKALKEQELIDICSDDASDEDMMPGRAPPRLGSPFNPKPRADDQHGQNGRVEAIDRSQSKQNSGHTANDPGEKNKSPSTGDRISSTVPVSATTNASTLLPADQKAKLKAVLLASQRQMADKFRSLQQPQASTGGPPATGDSHAALQNEHEDDGDSLFVPESRPEPKSKASSSKGKHSKVKDPIAARFAKLKERTMKKAAAGNLSFEEDVEFKKMRNAEKQRLEKLAADEEADRSPTPEPEDEGFAEESVDDEPPNLSYSDLYSEDETKAKKQAGRKRKRDSDNNDFAQDLADAPKKKRGRQAGTKNATAQKKSGRGQPYTGDDLADVLAMAKRGKPNATGAAKKDKKGTRKKRAPEMTNLASLHASDVFRDTAVAAQYASQPKFEKTGRRKDDLKNMLASIPAENKKIGQVDKVFLNECISKDIDGRGSVSADKNGDWLMKGMKTSFKPYQVLGVAFMRKQEKAAEEPKGGILADQMGLGKTIMMLGNIVNGRPKSRKNNLRKATLIVASPALVTQWFNEIKLHCHTSRSDPEHGIGHVIVYRAGERLMSNSEEEILGNADIVLTTYTEVSRSWPKANFPLQYTTAEEKEKWWRQHVEENKGILHRINFHRVVLDEAQAIKNHRGQTSMACRMVHAKHHWAITGTPIMNTIKEFYPYFKFLHEPHTGSYKIFKENFCDPSDPDGSEKLNVFLRKFMIRRTHLDTLFGARLLDLPQPKEHTVWLDFNDVERQIYEIVKKRFVQRINSISSRGELEKQYGHIWTMILRLRQICGHILLVQGTICDLLEREDFEKLNKITISEEHQVEEGSTILFHLRNVLAANATSKHIEPGVESAKLMESQSVPTDILGIGQTDGQVGRNFGLSFHFRKYLEDLVKSDAWDAIIQRTLCCGCRQKPDNPHVTSCFHIYCWHCLDQLQHMAAKRGYDGARCNECGEQYKDVQPCDGLESFENAQSTASGSQNGGPSSTKKKSKDKQTKDHHNWIDMDGQVLPSAKTLAVKSQVLNWLDEDPDCKIIIYSQFLPMIRILEKICKTEDWKCCKYIGTMSHESRNKAIKDFEKPEKKILLASLKCGGLGLNLTMASRVICLDPWWNSAVEQQAFCRVFRIGQQKETRMTRFVVKNTIDAAMMQVKERKQLEIDEVMDDSKKKERMDVKDLMKLFGAVEEDGDGKPFIFAEGGDKYDEHELRVPDVDEEDENHVMGNEE